MKKTILLSLTLVMMIILGNVSFSQINPGNPNYNAMKLAGQIPQPQQVTPTPPIPAILPSNLGPKNGTLKVPLDGTFTQAMGPNDDGSTGLMTAPFTFCFYGTNQTTFYINNNGNVSFGNPYYEYTPTGFPINAYPMIAAFWADVDTRNTPGGGSVWYKMTAHSVIIIWDAVGYFSYHNDKLNTFELIFTDGLDPLIGVGNNVAFSYTTMQWTTGDVSGGTNGFGGGGATVGINKGDGVKYALVGRFNHAGTDYDGPGGNADGIGYLTDKYFQFDACQENPIITNVPISPWAVALMCVALLGVGTFFIVRMRGLKTVKA